MSLGLTLDFYETELGKGWFWRCGPWSSAVYETEQAALESLAERKLEFSQLERYDPYEAALVGAEVNFGLEPPFDFWLIEGTVYSEPSVDSLPIGKGGRFTPPMGARILPVSQVQFDAMIMKYFEEHGRFPGS